MTENSLLEKVLGLQEKYASLQEQLSDPEGIQGACAYNQGRERIQEDAGGL